MKQHKYVILGLAMLAGLNTVTANSPTLLNNTMPKSISLSTIKPIEYVKAIPNPISSNFLAANKKPSNYDGSFKSLRPQFKEPEVEDLPIYNPNKDKTPAEHIKVQETNFSFTGDLQVRPDTDHIVIHHVAIPSGDYSAEKIHQYHKSHNGWAGIGYHYVIRRNGLIQRGRPLAVVGAQASGENLHSIGICMAGNFDQEKVEKDQYQSLVKLVANLVELYNLPLSGEIVGHRDYNDTSCPGDNLYELLPRLRQDVRAQVRADQKAGIAPSSKRALAIQERATKTAFEKQKIRLTQEANQVKIVKTNKPNATSIKAVNLNKVSTK